MHERPTLPVTRRIVSRHASKVLGGESSVHAFYDESEDNVVAIVTCSGTPSGRLTAVSTASLHATPNLLEHDDIRVELLLVTDSRYDEAANVLVDSGFDALSERLEAADAPYYDVMRQSVV